MHNAVRQTRREEEESRETSPDGTGKGEGMEKAGREAVVMWQDHLD